MPTRTKITRSALRRSGDDGGTPVPPGPTDLSWAGRMRDFLVEESTIVDPGMFYDPFVQAPNIATSTGAFPTDWTGTIGGGAGASHDQTLRGGVWEMLQPSGASNNNWLVKSGPPLIKANVAEKFGFASRNKMLGMVPDLLSNTQYLGLCPFGANPVTAPIILVGFIRSLSTTNFVVVYNTGATPVITTLPITTDWLNWAITCDGALVKIWSAPIDGSDMVEIASFASFTPAAGGFYIPSFYIDHGTHWIDDCMCIWEAAGAAP